MQNLLDDEDKTLVVSWNFEASPTKSFPDFRGKLNDVRITSNVTCSWRFDIFPIIFIQIRVIVDCVGSWEGIRVF